MLPDLEALQRRYPHIPDLPGLWHRDLGPMLGALEQERRAALRAFRRKVLLLAGGLLALVLLLSALLPKNGDWWIWSLFVVLGGGLFGYGLLQQPLEALRRQAKTRVIERLCGLTGLRYGAGAPDFPLEIFSAAGLLPGYNRSTLEDQLAGSVRGVPLTLCEAHLVRRTRRSKGGSQNTTVFRGLLIRTPLPGPPMPAPLLIAPDWGRIGNFLAGLGKRPRIAGDFDPAFDRTYEVYGHDAEAAHARLTPPLQRCLLRLADLADKKPSLALAGQDLLIALPRHKNSFEGFKVFQPFDSTAPLEALLEDLELLAQLVEALELPPSQ